MLRTEKVRLRSSLPERVEVMRLQEHFRIPLTADEILKHTVRSISAEFKEAVRRCVRFYRDAPLPERPLIRVGTIHSVKGMEADVVYLLDEVPPRVLRSLRERERFDEELRVFFVGATRARRELVVVACRGSPFEPLYRAFGGGERASEP